MGLLAEQFDQPDRFSDSFGQREGPVNMQGLSKYYDTYDDFEGAFRLRPDTYLKWKWATDGATDGATSEETAIGIAGGMKGNEDVYRQRVDENERAAWLTGTGDLGATTYDSFGDFTDYLDKEFGNGVLGFGGKERYYPSEFDDFGPGMLGYGSQVAGTLLGGPLGMGLGLLGQGVDYDNRLDRYNAAIAKHAGIYDASNEDRGFLESLFSYGSLLNQSDDRWDAITQKGLEDYFGPDRYGERAMFSGDGIPVVQAAPAPPAPMQDWEQAYSRDQDRRRQEAIRDERNVRSIAATNRDLRAANLQERIRREDLQEAIRREDARHSGYGDTDFGGGSMGTVGYAGGGTGGYGSPF